MPHPATPNTQTRQQGTPAPTMPERIAAILNVVRALLGYGQHLDNTLPERTDHPRFPTLAMGFGTHDLRRILGHVQRGLLRAMMLEKYLLARAAQGRDIEPTPPRPPADPDEIAALNLKCRPKTEPSTKPRKPANRPTPDSDDPLHFAIPSLEELEAQVRRRSIGRTIAEIGLDLGIFPAICGDEFWNELFEILRQFDGDFSHFNETHRQRRKAFDKERSQRPKTWTWDLWDKPADAIREILGYLVGEPTATAPSG